MIPGTKMTSVHVTVRYPLLKCHEGESLPEEANNMKTLTQVGCLFQWCKKGSRGKPPPSVFDILGKNDLVPFNEESTLFESRFQWSNRLRRLKGVMDKNAKKRDRKEKEADKGEKSHPMTVMLQGIMYAAHWAAPRGRYAFHEEEDVALSSGDNDDALERQEILLAGRDFQKQQRRREVFLAEARIGDFWKSTKLEEGVKIVRQQLSDDPGKVLVFCVSLVVLDLFDIGLVKNGIECLRYDGSVPKESRSTAVAEFQVVSCQG